MRHGKERRTRPFFIFRFFIDPLYTVCARYVLGVYIFIYALKRLSVSVHEHEYLNGNAIEMLASLKDSFAVVRGIRFSKERRLAAAACFTNAL